MPQSKQDESPEYPFIGPFGGIQSETSIGQIGNVGFQEVQNLIFRNAGARLVPGFNNTLVSPSGEVIIGMADFFNSAGTRLFVVWTPTKMYKYNSGGTWTQITGALTGNASQFMQWNVVGYKLYFSQQKDQVQVWDGFTAGFAPASASAVPAKYLMELDFHLIVGNTIEPVNIPAPNTVHWTGSGDGTDWTSFNAGQENLLNNLGPITGLVRLFQSGFVFHQWGITQVIPTGIGLAPFEFIPMGAVAKGNILPYSIASFGELISCYVGKDDIYLFDGTSSQGFGAKPIDGNRRLGARTRIFQDLFSAQLSNIFGFILPTANGFEFESYWLFIPSLNKAWVFGFDEGTWTQVFFAPGQLVGPVGTVPLQNIPTIAQLIGAISAQGWSPNSLTNSNLLDTMAISDGLTDSIDYLDPGTSSVAPTSGSINSNDGWYIKSGQLSFDDTRHNHTVSNVRLIIEDIAPNMTFNLRLTNDKGYSVSPPPITIGTGSGSMITIVVPVPGSITGKFITYEVSGPTGINVNIVEITPVFTIGGEVQAGNR